MAIDPNYLKELDKASRIINNTQSRVFGYMFSSIGRQIAALEPPIYLVTDKQKIDWLVKETNKIIKTQFSLSRADIKQEILQAAIKDANKYSKILGKFIAGKNAKYAEDTIYKWTDQHYTYIRDMFKGGKPLSEALAERKKVFERFFDNVGYDSQVKTLWRGMAVDMDHPLRKITVGDIYSDSAPASWSSSEKIAREFIRRSDKPAPIVLEVKKAKGMGYDIQKLSKHGNEAEVLIKDNEPMKVADVFEEPFSGVKHVVLEPMYNYQDNLMFTKPSVHIVHRMRTSPFNKSRVAFAGDSINKMYASLARSVTSFNKRRIAQLYMNSDTQANITYEIAKTFKLGGTGRAVRARARAFFSTSLSIAREDFRAVVESSYIKHANFWVFDAHMDSRTTPYCRAHDEHKYPVSKYPTREALAGAGIMVPAHFNCRSVIYLHP